MNSEVTKNNKAWGKLFDKYRILSEVEKDGLFEIKASQINEYREARLMTKFDHSINLPKIFKDNNLAILPITRGSYVISSFDAYKNIENKNTEITKVTFPDYIESIDYENINSEAMAINCAYISGILSDFIEEEQVLPTINGRMSSSKFSFNIYNTALNKYIPVYINNSQIEIDGGFEGLKSLSIIEAKNVISDDFLVRQLYYPFRLLKGVVLKEVKPIFMVYSNGLFSLYEYEFQETNNYNSLFLVKHKNYSIEIVDITLDEIVEVMSRVEVVDEPEISFPQADKFDRIINLCELLFENEMTRDEITLNYAFDPRQTNYYTDAGRYLELIKKSRENGEIVFALTDEGKSILTLKYKARQLKLVKLVLQHRVFKDALKLYLLKGETPSKDEIVNIMRDSNLYKVKAESTYRRRASTVSGWVDWVLDLQYK